MVNIPPEPNKEEIDNLRKASFEKLEADGLLKTLDEIDVNKFKNDDSYVKRFLMHHDNDQNLALGMVIDTLKWRKENKVNEITEEKLDQELLHRGSLNIHNRDIDGCKMLIFTVHRHVKGTMDPQKVKTLLVYWVERLEREEKGKWITVFFDMRETGMKNMDMDFIQYLINLFKCYYPWILNYIIVFEMPWILNAMWKIIKGWLPPKSIQKIKFVDKKSILTYVPIDQCLVAWGGTDDYEFQFDSESPDVSSTPITNGDIDAKKVHFQEGSSPSTVAEKIKTTETHISNGVVAFEIEPAEELTFQSNKIGTNASIILTNKFAVRYAFKIKTTSPDKYRVRPSMGVIEAGCHTEVLVTLCEQISASILVKDKFLVIAIPCETENINQQDFSLLLKNANKDDVHEIRMRVGMTNTELTDGPNRNHVPPVVQVPSEVISKIDQLLTRQSVLEEKMASVIRIVYGILVLMIALLFVFVITTNNLTSSLLAQANVPQVCLKENHDHNGEL